MIKEIYLFRHGHSRANAERFRKLPFPDFFLRFRKYFGFPITLKIIKFIDKIRGYNDKYPHPDRDVPLEKLGEEQAELTGKILAEKNILPDLILCSDYLRARQTTFGILQGIQKAKGVDYSKKVIFSELLIERDGGDEYGYPLSYYPVLFPETNEIYQKTHKLDFRPPGGESIRDVRYNRIPELENILSLLQFKTLFIVGHGITNSAIVSLLTGQDIEKVRIGSPNLGVYRFTSIEMNGKWELDPDFAKGKPIHSSIPFSA